ncbi:hypothetical protein F5888DRAFT_1002719 [Russula emetica]|nr:hypothetical protein F5888DRAFT_1002719 [Russula emetica]
MVSALCKRRSGRLARATPTLPFRWALSCTCRSVHLASVILFYFYFCVILYLHMSANENCRSPLLSPLCTWAWYLPGAFYVREVVAPAFLITWSWERPQTLSVSLWPGSVQALLGSYSPQANHSHSSSAGLFLGRDEPIAHAPPGASSRVFPLGSPSLLPLGSPPRKGSGR